jgi:hypothetical protein
MSVNQQRSERSPGVPLDAAHPEQEWIFTFGQAHRAYAMYERLVGVLAQPDGEGFRLSDRFVRVHGTAESAREQILRIFGQRWAFQYESELMAGVEAFHLTELVITPDWQPAT